MKTPLKPGHFDLVSPTVRSLTLSQIRRTVGLILLIGPLMLLLIGDMITAAQGTSSDKVYVADISGEIDLGLAPYLERVIEEATEEGAAAVIVEIDTPGGRLDAVLQMNDTLLDSEILTIAFVNRTAFSAGALVAIASEEIYMVPGSVMGAATPIDGATGETASEKTISAVRATFKATAEQRGRDPVVAEAMVDPSIEIDGLVAEGKLLTLTDVDAARVGYADGIVDSREELLAAVGLADAEVIDVSMSFAERLVRVLTSPIVSSLLVLGGIFLIIGDLFVEGIGVGTALGVLLLGIFFYGNLLAGLAGWEDVLLVVLGLALIVVEVFVIPGFGIFGIAGIISILAGVFLAISNRDIRTPEQNDRALLTMGLIGAGLLAGSIAFVWLLPKSDRFGKLVLSADVGDTYMEVPVSKPKQRGWLNWFGKPNEVVERDIKIPEIEGGLYHAHGVALSDLRPAGIATIGGKRVDVVTEGDYIDAGEPIVVVSDEGYRRVVKHADE